MRTAIGHGLVGPKRILNWFERLFYKSTAQKGKQLKFCYWIRGLGGNANKIDDTCKDRGCGPLPHLILYDSMEWLRAEIWNRQKKRRFTFESLHCIFICP